MNSKEEFIQRVLEEKVFAELKDNYFGGIKDIKYKYRDYNIDFDRVYRRIINYRIDKYGTSFVSKPGKDFHVSSSEYIRRATRLRQARYHRRRKEEYR